MQKLKLTIYFRRKIKVLFRVYISDIGTPVYSKTNITNNLTQKKESISRLIIEQTEY